MQDDDIIHSKNSGEKDYPFRAAAAARACILHTDVQDSVVSLHLPCLTIPIPIPIPIVVAIVSPFHSPLGIPI